MTPLLHDLLSGVVDVVVGRVGGRALELPLNYRVLYTEPVCFVARPDHPLASMPRLSWADLAARRWIVWPTGTPIRQSIDNALVDNGVMLPENTIESASMNVTSNLLQSSDMISILSLRLAQHYAEHRQLTILNLPRIEQKGSVGVFWRKKRSTIASAHSFSALPRRIRPLFPFSMLTMPRIHDVIGSTFQGFNCMMNGSSSRGYYHE